MVGPGGREKKGAKANEGGRWGGVGWGAKRMWAVCLRWWGLRPAGSSRHLAEIVISPRSSSRRDLLLAEIVFSPRSTSRRDRRLAEIVFSPRSSSHRDRHLAEMVILPKWSSRRDRHLAQIVISPRSSSCRRDRHLAEVISPRSSSCRDRHLAGIGGDPGARRQPARPRRAGRSSSARRPSRTVRAGPCWRPFSVPGRLRPGPSRPSPGGRLRRRRKLAESVSEAAAAAARRE